jgi:hypothetical protein
MIKKSKKCRIFLTGLLKFKIIKLNGGGIKQQLAIPLK